MLLNYLYIEQTEHKKVKNIHLRNNKSQVRVHYESNLNAFNASALRRQCLRSTHGY